MVNPAADTTRRTPPMCSARRPPARAQARRTRTRTRGSCLLFASPRRQSRRSSPGLAVGSTRTNAHWLLPRGPRAAADSLFASLAGPANPPGMASGLRHHKRHPRKPRRYPARHHAVRAPSPVCGRRARHAAIASDAGDRHGRRVTSRHVGAFSHRSKKKTPHRFLSVSSDALFFFLHRLWS